MRGIIAREGWKEGNDGKTEAIGEHSDNIGGRGARGRNKAADYRLMECSTG